MPQNPLGFQAVNAAGNFSAGQVDAERALFVGQRHGALYEPSFANAVGVAANPIGSPVTTSVALATTYVGICLSNPAGSGRNLALLNVSASLLVAPSTITTLALAAGYAAGGITAHTTPLTVYSSIIGTTETLVGLVDSACTLVGTPATIRVLGQAPTATTSFSVDRDIGGSIIIPPGGWVATVTNIAGPSSGFVGSMMWEEIEIPA